MDISVWLKYLTIWLYLNVDANNRASDWYFEDIANDIPDPSRLPFNSTADDFLRTTFASGGIFE